MNDRNSHDSTGSKMKWYTVIMIGALLVCPLKGAAQSQNKSEKNDTPTPVQIVALDECDPKTFNMPTDLPPGKAGVGADFCKNVSLPPFVTAFNDLFDQAKKGKPDPNWDFEPDDVTVKKGAQIVVVNQGGEPHTFTEVKNFGGGFIGDLNGGEPTANECSGGFKNLAVARTRILQGSQFQVNGLSIGEHHFQCCIHPWMRVTVEVKDQDHDHDKDHGSR
jgi:plastocyanin